MRYTGPNNRKARRYRFSILEDNKEFIKGKKRTTPPGDHGNGRPQKLSNYGEHFYEKQKLRYMYGLTETQLKNTFVKAKKQEGVLGLNLLIALESRLDNIIYRFGVGSTRRQSRQFVNHGLVLVNGNKVDIPSYQTKVGDIISIKPKYNKNVLILGNLQTAVVKPFVKFDIKTLTGEYIRLPQRDELTGQINESLVVEHYNK